MRKYLMKTSNHRGSDPTAGHQHPVQREAVAMSEPQARERDRRIAREHTEALLDEALNESFPASDPVAITPRKHDSE
ncbi:MAG: hypothetical protein ABI128_01080 [Rhodanobacter sp.]